MERQHSVPVIHSENWLDPQTIQHRGIEVFFSEFWLDPALSPSTIKRPPRETATIRTQDHSEADIHREVVKDSQEYNYATYGLTKALTLTTTTYDERAMISKLVSPLVPCESFRGELFNHIESQTTQDEDNNSQHSSPQSIDDESSTSRDNAGATMQFDAAFDAFGHWTRFIDDSCGG